MHRVLTDIQIKIMNIKEIDLQELKEKSQRSV